jgi:two-component system CheB/CheR fusion protein
LSARNKERKAADSARNDPSVGSDEALGQVAFEERAKAAFPVIGIGASAGGLEACSQFFEAMAGDSGMAFVLVQHLPPERESLVADILSRKTTMPVHQVEPGMRVEPDHVYVIRPGYTLTIENGRLQLGQSVAARGHRRPVDDFFRSLAAEQKEKTIVIVMSGMGSNGSAGAQAVKAAGGICLAQDPDTAEFPSMPYSLIHSGYADFVAAPADMPQLLMSYAQHPYYAGGGESREHAEDALRRERQHFNEILALLRAGTGRDYSGYKRPTLLRRIQRRMGLAQLTSFSDYVALLRSKPEEVAGLNTDLTINVTGFFRDAPAWEALRTQAIEPMVAERDNLSQLRAWVAGCASGEEAYTVAMLLVEEAQRQRKRLDIKIFATDTAEKMLANARAGQFPGGIEGDISQERLDRFFEKDDHAYRIRKDLRELVVFAPQNLLTDPPFSRLDLCTCRNLLIYLEPVTQRRVISLMHFSLRANGVLFLGNSETVGQADDLFEPVDRKWRIYRRIGPTRHELLRMPAGHRGMIGALPIRSKRAIEHAGFGQLIHRVVSEHHAPTLVVIDRHDRIVYFQGRTERYLSHPPGEPTRNLLEMTREPLRSRLRIAVRDSMTSNRSATSEEVSLGDEPGDAAIQVTVAPLHDQRFTDHFVVTFSEHPRTAAAKERPPPARTPKRGKSRGRDPDVLRRELNTVREELQSTIEELESSNEELKASNEEVTSINEELQSTNEELETSKEELQSLNEELTTVNSQLQAKVEELEATTSDLRNLLDSTDIAVVFLDTSLRIRRFTPAMNDLLELIPSDIGRPIMHLARKFEGADIFDTAATVLTRLIPTESEVRSHSGRWYACRALPYRTTDNRIDGVVLTFVDVTQRKRADDVIRDAQTRLQAIVQQLQVGVLFAEGPSGRLVLGNQQAATLFGHPYPLPFLNSDWSSAHVAFKGLHPNGRPYQRDEWPLSRALKGETVADEGIIFVRPDGSRGTMSASAAPVLGGDGAVAGAVATFWDISDRTEAAQRLRESEQRFRMVADEVRIYAIVMLDATGTIVMWNPGAESLFGHRQAEALGQSHRILYSSIDTSAGVPEQRMKQALAASEAIADERQMCRKDGTTFWASGTLAALRADSGEHRGFLMLLRDASLTRAHEAVLEQAKNDAEGLRNTAEAANRSKDDFVATVSHELRTPLTAILLWSRMLREGKLDAEGVREGILTIERAARAQQQLVGDLLDVSRISSGKLRLSLRKTSLAASLEASLDAVKPTAEARGVSLVAEISSEIGVVRADPDRLQQIVWNLLNNAVKFTPSGGGVTLRAWREAGDVLISVTDTGIGIAAAFLPRLFDRFSQANVTTTREHTGLGLGLTISRQLAQLHGGTLTGESAGEGKGATFLARLPLARVPPDGEDMLEMGDARVDLKGRRILLVEDEDETRNAIRTFLAGSGAEIVAVNCARDGLGAVAAQSFDIVVTDIAMPNMDGYAFLEELRKRQHTGNGSPTPAVALSAFARPEDKRRAAEVGFNAYVVKPVEGDQLVSVLSSLMRAR